MAKKRKIRPRETWDAFYCTFDAWNREYSFGIKYPEFKRDKNGRSFHEWDRVEIKGKIRHHSRGRKTSRRPFETVEVALRPIHTPLNDWKKDPEDIGYIWIGRDANLGVVIDLPTGIYYSLINSLSENQFKELTVMVRDFRYSRGSVDRIAFNPEETPPEEIY